MSSPSVEASEVQLKTARYLREYAAILKSCPEPPANVPELDIRRHKYELGSLAVTLAIYSLDSNEAAGTLTVDLIRSIVSNIQDWKTNTLDNASRETDEEKAEIGECEEIHSRVMNLEQGLQWADQFAEGAPPDYVEALNDWNDKVDRASKGEPFEEIASNSEEESVSGVESNVSAPKPSIAPSESVNSSRQEMKPDPDVDSEQ